MSHFNNILYKFLFYLSAATYIFLSHLSTPIVFSFYFLVLPSFFCYFLLIDFSHKNKSISMLTMCMNSYSKYKNKDMLGK